MHIIRNYYWCSKLAIFLTILTISNFSYGENINIVNINIDELNCTNIPEICPKICKDNEISMSSTFCDASSGICICDCRDVLPKSCIFTPFTPCFQNCVQKNPNPSVFLYEGANCPSIGGQLCACQCSLRDDYIETNDIF